jgi:hypothetical protein
MYAWPFSYDSFRYIRFFSTGLYYYRTPEFLVIKYVREHMDEEQNHGEKIL